VEYRAKVMECTPCPRGVGIPVVVKVVVIEWEDVDVNTWKTRTS
jgi:hypothetical protein